jgi:hypothetical protein
LLTAGSQRLEIAQRSGMVVGLFLYWTAVPT